MSDRCKHGLTEETCHYCQGGSPTGTKGSVGNAWIKTLDINWKEAKDFSYKYAEFNQS